MLTRDLVVAHPIGQEFPGILTLPPGPRSRAMGAQLSSIECPAFDARRAAREAVSGADHAPILYERAIGSNVVDVDGNRYVDMAAGFGALALGHAHPEIIAAADSQSRILGLALGDLYGSPIKAELLAELAALHPTPGARVLLGLSGADAVTAALKTALLHTGRAGVVAFRGSYHGLSHGPLAACGLTEAFRTPFEAHLGIPVQFAPFPVTVEALAEAVDSVKQTLAKGATGAVVVEPLLGRGGCIVPHRSFLHELRRLCDAYGTVLIVDEIWTGLGRSGEWVSSVASGVVPDILCFGKALGGGHPISACVGAASIMEAWGKFGGTALHTATHFGSPVACATALLTLRILKRDGLVERSKQVGRRFVDSLLAATKALGVKDVRGSGLMVGIEFEGGSPRALAVARDLLRAGYIVVTGGSNGASLTLSPALTIGDHLLGAFTDALVNSLERIPAG